MLPFGFIDSTGAALAVATLTTALGLFTVGAVKTVVTRTNPLTAGLQNLIITTVGGVVAYFLGVLVNSALA